MKHSPPLSPKSLAFVEEFSLATQTSGPLTGLTFGVKDIIDIAGYKTGCGNPIWKKEHPPAASHAICVEQLLSAGAQCVGKTVSSQFAFNLIGENIFFPTPLNPKAPERVPGGSSSGSASAVACGFADFALGTDTGGSTRVPASNCGIFAMRPSHDIISLAGIMPFAPTFDTLGIFAKSLDVLHKVARVLLSLPPSIPSTQSPKQIYLIEEAFKLLDPPYQPIFHSFLKLLNNVITLKPISIREIDQETSVTHLDNWYQTYTTIQFSEIWSSLGSWIENSHPELGETIATSFKSAKQMDRSKLPHTLSTRELYFDRLQTFLGPEALLCIPTTPTIAPLKGSIGKDRTQETYYHRLVSLTSIAGIGRLPQITVPCIEIEGIPLGLSFLSTHRNDLFLLQALKKLLPSLFKSNSQFD